jgi:Fe-S cluster assembly protein SufD
MASPNTSRATPLTTPAKPMFPADGLLDAFAPASPPGWNAPWLTKLRAEALDTLRTKGLPTPRDERWKYTNVGPLARRTFGQPCDRTEASSDRAAIDQALSSAPEVAGAQRVVLINGSIAQEYCSEGMQALSLAQALANTPDELAPHLGQIADPSIDGFAALSMAAFVDGVWLNAKASDSTTTLHIVHLTCADVDTLAAPRHVMVLEPRARANVVETYLSVGDAAHACVSTTEIVLGEASELNHFRLQLEQDTSFHIACVEAQVGKDAHFASHQISLGAKLSRSDVNAKLGATGARCTFNGLFVVGERQHTDMHTRVDHLQPEGTSDELIKGILDGHGHGVFNGRVIVHPGAQKTDSKQANHNLLLSRDAEIDTKPQLEIFADDVKCAHGATVGQLDANMLFYMRSRGLSEDEARSMLTYAFAEEVLREMPLPAIRECALARLAIVLPDIATPEITGAALTQTR